MQNSCIINAKILLEDWEPPVIVDREAQIKEFKTSVIDILLNGNVPPLVYVYGASGSGKTFVIKKLIKDNYDLIKKYTPNFKYVYLNCRNFGTPSLYTFFIKLSNELSSYLPIHSNYLNQMVHSIPLRGWTLQEHIEVVKEIIKQKKLNLLIILDEADKLGESVFNDLIYILKGMNEENPHWVGVSAVLISNNIKLLSSLPKSTFDRISVKIHFTSYGVNDLYQILKVHSEYALKKESWNDEILSKIAKMVYEFTNSAREAKLTLYNLAKLSKDKLDINLIPKAIEETQKNLIFEEIITRPLHDKLALLSVIEFQKRMNRLSQYGKVGLFKYTANLPTKSNIYKVYKDICKKYGESPKSYRIFFDIINELNKYGLVEIDVQSLGRARGITTLVRPSESIEILEPLIKKALGIE